MEKVGKYNDLMNSHNTHGASVLPYEERTDEALMVQYAAGDERAFAELYGRYRSRAYGYLCRRIKNPRAVDELFQQVFLKLHRSREVYRSEHLFSTWFFTICRNVVIDEFRRIKRAPLNVELEEEHLEGRSATEQVRAIEGLPAGILSALPERQREAVRLKFEEDLDFGEIATKLNTTSENVRQLVSRGIRKLKSTLVKKDE